MRIDGVLDLSKAHKRAKALLGEVAHDRDPLAEKRKAEVTATNMLKSIAEDYLKREGKNLRNVERRSIFKRNISRGLGLSPVPMTKR
jgi:hypothetical protein